MLAVVRKPPESMQMPLSLFLRMPIITSAVMPPAKEDRLRGPPGQKGDLWPWVKAVGEERGWHCRGPPAPSPPPSAH